MSSTIPSHLTCFWGIRLIGEKTTVGIPLFLKQGGLSVMDAEHAVALYRSRNFKTLGKKLNWNLALFLLYTTRHVRIFLLICGTTLQSAAINEIYYERRSASANHERMP